MTITGFIEARLAEDEEIAAAAGGAPWHQPDPDHYLGAVEDDNGEIIVRDEGEPTAAQAVHIARRNPARSLREVAALRAHLALWINAIEKMDPMLADDDADPAERAVVIGRVQAAREVVFLDAAIWSDHPDYDPTWTPEIPAAV